MSRSLIAAGLVITSLLWVVAAPAEGTNPCSGTRTAFDADWSDHYWVGQDYYDGYPSCDKWGMYTVAIQRINDGAIGGARSIVDGKYGSLTQLDVRDFQQIWGLRRDGLVGNNTWSRYDNYLRLRGCFAGPDCYWYISVYLPSLDTFRQIGGSSANWQIQYLNYTGWVVFDTGGIS